MLRLSRPLPTRRRDGTIALINIVFLMLIFFLIAGTLAPPLERDIDLISTSSAERAEPSEALFITRDGDLRWHGRETNAAAHMQLLRADAAAQEDLQVKVAADRELPAVKLIEIVATLRQAGADRVSIITERAAE